MASGSNSRGLVLLLITSCFFITGILFDYMPMIIDDHIKRTIELATNEEILTYWKQPPVDVNSYYWLYEISNPEQFQSAGEKAQVRQVGPFHFISRLEKRIIGLSANKFRITYNSTRFMRLNESYSRELLDVPVTLPNPFYTSILEGVRVNAGELDAQSRAVAFGTINRMTERFNESILNRNTTARQALLGREMPIVNKLARMAQTMGMEGRMPELSNSGKYGYVSLTNNSLSGPFEIYTGYQETARSLGELISYKGKRRLNYYDGKCNRMQASVGELRPMPIDPNKRLEMFQPSFCRIIHLEPTGQHKLREGVAVSYALVSDDFASAANNPDNRCFCVNSSGPTSYTMENNRLDDNHCSLDGVIDLGPCSYGAPLLVAPSSVQLDSRIINSLGPAFDPDLLHGEVNEIDMADDKSQVVILKRVGIPIRADITITLFMRLVRDPIFKETANVPEVSYLPLVTVRETVTIPPKLAQIIINLESFISLTYHIKVVMYLSAVVLLFWLSGHYYCITTDNTGRQASQSNEPGSGNGGGGSNGAQLRRATLTSTVLGGGGGGGSGNGSAGGANGLRRGEDPSGQQQTMANGDTHKRSSGQFRSSLTSSASIAAEIRNDDRLTGNPITTAPTNTATTMSGGNRGGPARSSILLASSRALGTVEEVSAGSGGGGGAGSQVGGGVGAGDSTSSERANSADSSRSLPPSRHTSRLGSLSQTSVELEAAESGGQQQQQPRQTGTNGGDAAMNVVGADGGPISSGPDERTTGGGSGGEGNNLRRLKREPTSMMRAPQQQSGGSRIFSKVDEQLGASARGNKVAAASSTIRANPGPIQAGAASIKQKAMNGASAGQPCIGNATGTNPSDSCEGGSGGGVGGVGPNGELSPSSAGQQQQTSAQDSGELAEAAQFGGGRRRKRKNWFMNVYSNLVQMLNGLRSTINDASQLEVNENNDYRDKQLEMLAGKIDNWYNGHDGGGSGGGGPTRPPRPTAAAASANATDAAANDGNEGADAEAEVPTMGPSSNASRGLDTRLMVSPATVAGSSSGSAARQRLAGGAPLPAASSATTGTQTQTDGGDQSEPADRSNGSTNDPGSVAGSVQVNTDTGAAMGQQEDEAPQPRTKGPPTTAAAATTETTTAAAPSQPLASSPSSSSPSAGNGIKESRSDSVKRPRAAGATTDTAELEASSTAAPVAPGVQDPETVSKFRDSSSYAQRRSSSISSAHSPQPTPKDATLASAAAAEPSEANSTERNGLNSRSMRVESSRAIDDGEDSERGAAAGQVATNGRPPPPMMISQQQQQDAPTTRVTPAASGGSETQEGPQSAEAAPDRSKQTAADQQKQQAPTEQKRLQSSELAAAAAHEGASSTASSPPPARSPFESVANGSAGEDETETEPETEAEVEANELDKATTLDRIEAALNGTDEQLLLAAGAAPNGRPSSPPSERPSIDSASSTKGNNNNKVALSKQSSGPPSAVGGAPINSSTASLDSVIDLKTSTAAAGPANKQAPLTNGLNNVGHQLVNQSTTANNGAQQLGPNLAGKRIDGRSGAQQLGGPDKLLELNGLATRGTTTTTATAPVVTTTQTIKASSNGTGPAASITTTTTRPDGAREKLVAIDDDDDDDDRDEGDDGHGDDDDYEIEIDRLEQPNSPRQQEGPLEMRTKNSSKSLVSNPLLQSSGREQRRQRLLSSNDDAATNNIVHASADKDAANVNDHGEQYQDEPPAREQAVIGDEDGVSFSSSSSNGSRNGIKNYTPAAAAVASSQVAPSLPLEAGLPETNDCEQRVQPTLQLPRGNSVAANTATRQQISGETDATTTLTTTSTTTMTNSDEQEEEGERTIDGIQSVGSSPAPSSPLASSSVDRSDDSRIVANDPLASQTVVTAAATGAAVTTAGTRPASRLAPINLANNRKQLRQQKEQATRSNAYNGPMRQQQQQQQQPMTQHNEIRAAETNAAARLALIGSNRYDLDDSNGNNILNEKIISHYQSQVARVAAGRQMRVWNAPAVALFIVYTVC